ncbi:uncharacterized protein LOC129316009 [Prosopis cineraria]|uniref:uncharacterized protein LOC129316009 n=1 Tax=Prosopis cineraria TaxID=364024 RepID=UPI00240EBB86|nr:uncharacterized protein LOC129316009 [Prosopis cineraria]
MRFLEFVFWCGSATRRSEVQSTTSTQPLAEDEGSLVSPRTRHRKKRGRLITATTAQEWRPSLGSISEDHIVQARERGDARNRKVEPEREVKRRSPDAASKVHHRSYGDDHKRLSVPTVMPTFSPTPFMF